MLPLLNISNSHRWCVFAINIAWICIFQDYELSNLDKERVKCKIVNWNIVAWDVSKKGEKCDDDNVDETHEICQSIQKYINLRFNHSFAITIIIFQFLTEDVAGK